MLASVLVVMIFSQLTACLPNGLTTKLRTKSLGWSVIGTIFWSQEKSRIDRSMRESRCAKFHVPSEKQSNTSAFLVVDICLKAHILSHKWETHQCSCKNSKGGLEKIDILSGFPSSFWRHRNLFHPIHKGSKAPGDSAQRLCDLGTSPQVSWEGATLENEVSDFSVFLCVLFCNGTSNMPSLNFFWHLRCFFAFDFSNQTTINAWKYQYRHFGMHSA